MSAIKKILMLPNEALLEYGIWLLAIGGTAGSLIMSQVLDLIPCELCWYQRILMFPLPIIVGIALYKKDKIMPYYVVVLSGIGAVIAAYHWAGQMFFAESLSCNAGASCAEILFEVLGFMTIPFGAMLVFLGMLAGSLWLIWRQKQGGRHA